MAQLTLLGTKGGPSLRETGPSFMPSASHLAIENSSIIIDCGLGVTAGMVRAGFPLTNLTHIFITHYHSDHCLELGGLVHTAWTSGLMHRVKIFGPAGLNEIWEGFQRMMAFDIGLRIFDEGRPPLDDLVELNVYGYDSDGPVDVLNDGRLSVTALRNSHPPIHDSFALRFQHAGKVVTFSGDTAYLPALAEFARGSDILVHEAMFVGGVDYVVGKTKTHDERLRNHLIRSHSLASEAAQIAAAAKAKHLLLNHLIPPERRICSEAQWTEEVLSHYSGRCSIGYDGFTIKY